MRRKQTARKSGDLQRSEDSAYATIRRAFRAAEVYAQLCRAAPHDGFVALEIFIRAMTATKIVRGQRRRKKAA